MPLETGTYISDLVSTNPVGTDTVDKADEHLRLIKSTVKATFPNITGAVTPTHTELNFVDGVTSAIQTQIDSKAPLASPNLTGVPLAPTAAVDTTTQQLATTAYVVNQGYLKSSTAAATYSTPASVSSALGPYLTSATAAATYATPGYVSSALAPYATTSYVNTQIAANAPGGFTFLGTVATTSGTSLPLSVSLGSYSFISVVYNGVSGTNGATSTFQINGVTFATTASAGGTTAGTFWIELLQGYCTFSVQGPGGNPIAVGTNVPVTSATSTLTFSLTPGSFDAGSISVYGVK